MDKKSIKFTDPVLSSDASDRRRQMESMIRSKLAQRRSPWRLRPRSPTSQAVSTTLSADWPLAPGAAEQVLLAVHEIQTKVEAADLAGLKERKPSRPEEQELAEEMTQMHQGYGDENRPPGTPQFIFIAKITDADRETLADAFSKAKSQAARTAKAAGRSVGWPGCAWRTTSRAAWPTTRAASAAAYRTRTRGRGCRRIMSLAPAEDEAIRAASPARSPCEWP